MSRTDSRVAFREDPHSSSVLSHILSHSGAFPSYNLVPRACDPREGTRGSGIIRCRKPGILAKIELCIPYQRPIRFLPETDYPRASRSFPRIAGSGNEIVHLIKVSTCQRYEVEHMYCLYVRVIVWGKGPH
jgi:hypothetical protein